MSAGRGSMRLFDSAKRRRSRHRHGDLPREWGDPQVGPSHELHELALIRGGVPVRAKRIFILRLMRGSLSETFILAS